jgi:hypothetical protein
LNKAGAFGMINFNGHCGCGFCKILGVYSNEYRKLIYPLDLHTTVEDINAILRTPATNTTAYININKNIQTDLYGVQQKPVLTDLSYWDVSGNCVFEAMHCLSGITKTLLKAWTSPKVRFPN